MLKYKVQVLSVLDEVRAFADKDKDGNKLSTTTNHRVTTISASYTDGKIPNMIVIHGWDLPSTFILPKQGEAWDTPSLRSINQVQPLVYDARI